MENKDYSVSRNLQSCSGASRTEDGKQAGATEIISRMFSSLELPDLPNVNIGHQVQCEFHINNIFFFLHQKISHNMRALHVLKNAFIIYMNFKFDKTSCVLFANSTLAP